ncbi:MAG: hypothetical protein AMXMBFR84_45350 [Candidatus Hydrogenedentota bacterium]
MRAEVASENPVSGSFTINVQTLASASVATSSTSIGAAINPAAALNSSGIATTINAGTFTINGVQFNVDPTTNSLNNILSTINGSAAGVTATYNAATDKVTFANTTPGDTSIINFGASGDTSNLLNVLNVVGATQSTVAGVTQVTSTRNLGAVDPADTLNTISFAGGAVTSGSFQINGTTITVDNANDSLSAVIARINASDAGVSASYDTATDTIRVVSNTLGSRTIRFTAGTSNFLNVTNLTTATQTAGTDSTFTVNGGPVQTRNSNQVTDAIGGVTLNFLSVGTSTVTVETDNDAIVEDVQAFVTAYNESITSIRALVGQGGRLENDATIRQIDTFLKSTVFNTVTGLGGSLQTLLDIGISTGSTFTQENAGLLELDEEAFLEALQEDPGSVQSLFSNSNGNGIADQLFTYLDETTGLNGFLNQRSRSNGIIEQQIDALNDRIERLEQRVEFKEQRLRAQFARLETLSSSLQSQSSSLAAIASQF